MPASPALGYRQWLAARLAEGRLQNPSFSLRSFARRLGVSPAYLSLLISGKRRLTTPIAIQLAERLSLSPADRAALLAAADKKKKSPPETEDAYFSLPVDQFQMISQWHHFAILSLSEVPGAKADPAWIAERLGIQHAQAAEAFARLKRLGIIKESRGRYRQVSPPLATSDDMTQASIREHARQHLHLAEQALDREPSPSVDYSSLTMAISPRRIPQAKEEIRKFRRRLCRLLETGRKEKVYTLSVQLYPLEKKGDHA